DPGGGRLPRRREVSPLRRQPVRPDVLPPPPEAPWHGRCEPEGRRPPEQHRLAVRVRDDGVPRVGGEQPGGGAGGGLAGLLRRRSEAHSDAGLARAPVLPDGRRWGGVQRPAAVLTDGVAWPRSEERRVGNGCVCQLAPGYLPTSVREAQ